MQADGFDRPAAQRPLVMTVVVTAFIAFMEGAQRHLLIQYPKRQIGDRMVEAQLSRLSLKLNTPGVSPAIAASALVLLPTTILSFNANQAPEWLSDVTAQLGYGRPLYLVVYVALIVFFTLYYAAIAFNPTETAESLRKRGGFIPGIRPDERTAEYIDYVLSRITIIGAAYLAACYRNCYPAALACRSISGGSTLLIVVLGTLEPLENTKTSFRVTPST
jgi:preprotein translocase subunit SecY